MTERDMSADIAALLNPYPLPPDDDPDVDTFGVPTAQVDEDREDMAESLRTAWSEGGEDPLLSALADLRRQRLRLEEELRLLIAYARRFTHPRPYRLIDLANATGMSISGVRTAYEADEVGQVAEILGRLPVDQMGGER